MLLHAGCALCALAIVGSAVFATTPRSDPDPSVQLFERVTPDVGRPIAPSRIPPQGALLEDEVAAGLEVMALESSPTEPETLGSEVAGPSLSVDVRAFGAVGDGLTDDTAAIQRAIDEVAAVGGGEVFFPPGVYVAAGVEQDSSIDLAGSEGAVLKHPDGLTPRHIVQGRVQQTEGSIDRGSSVLEVGDPTLFKPGVVVAVRGAAGASSVQHTRLTAFASPDTLALIVDDGSEFHQRGNHVLVGNEVVFYGGMVGGALLDVRRGQLGTSAVSHAAGTRVAQLSVLYAEVVEVSGNRIVLDRPALFGVREASVWVGSTNMTVRNLEFHGNRQPTSSGGANPFPLDYSLARWVSVKDCTIRYGDHGAISLDRGTRDSSIEGNTLMHNGSPQHRLGSSIWVFRGAMRNRLSANHVGGDSNWGIALDDRSTRSTEWDAPANGNVVEDNVIEVRRAQNSMGIAVFGSSGNTITGNVLGGTLYGIRVYSGGQGTSPIPATGNVVEDNVLRSHHYGLWVDSWGNRFVRTRFSDVVVPIHDVGNDNTFEETHTD